MKKINLDNIKKYYLIFMMYAVFGWLYEVFLEVVVYKWGFTNRGVLFGPYCPVYGVGALLFIFLIYPLIKERTLKKQIIMIPIVFILCMLVATTVELITSYICEIFMGSWPWQTYADYKYNFEARIALSPSIRFGIGGVAFLYIFEPLFEKMLNKLSKRKLNKVFYIVLTIFMIDFIWLILKKFI
ncbi:MAG: putative ABC transporter permease [Bacilli bacterium]|nr:putative ABC transporter permease [Bacilli bacterium]